MKKILLLILLTYNVVNLFAYKLFFEHITVEDGLSSNVVKVTFIDSYGYVWLGSFNGIDRFDGVGLTKYNSYFGIESKSVTSIAEDEEKGLWIGTEEGLYYWDRISTSFLNISVLNQPEIHITNLKYYCKGVIFISSNIGFFSVNTKTKETEYIPFHKDANHLLNYSTGFIIEDDQVYLSTKGGFVQYDISLKRTIIYNTGTDVNIKSKSYGCIAKNANDIYLGLGLNGVVCFSLDSQQFKIVDKLNGVKVLALATKNNKLYFGTDANGLMIWDLNLGEWETIVQENNISTSISSNSITSILLGDDDIMWVGTYQGGASYVSLSENEFTTYVGDGNEMLNRSIRSIYFAKDQSKFIGTRDGFFVLSKDGKAKYFSEDNNTLLAKIILKFHDYKDEILIGTYGGGISSYSTKKKQLQPWRDDIFHNESIYTFEEDRKGNLWVGGFKGIYMVSPSGKVEIFNQENSVFNDFLAYHIKVDKFNRIWIGGKNGVFVYEYKNNQLGLVHRLNFGTAVKGMYCYLDSDDCMWVGTIKHGVFKFDMEFNILNHITAKEGLCNNAISSIIQANSNEFWFSTLNGLTLYNQEKDSCNNFYSSYGLPGITYCRGASFKDQQGKIWLGNEKGLICFNHDKVSKIRHNHNIRITDIFVGGKPLNQEIPGLLEKPIEDIESLNLSGKYNSIGFRFSNLNNNWEERENFMVMLQGKDDNWVDLKNKNLVYYNALKPGDYLFKVGVSNDAGNVVESSIRIIKVTIRSQWHNSRLTIIIVIFVLLMLSLFVLYYISYYRKQIVKALKNKEDERKRYETSHLDISKSKAIFSDVQNYIEQSKSYLNPELKILHISKELNISVHDISQSINQNLNQGFSDFINSYRIEQCKRRLQSDEYAKYTMLAIAEICGFNSKSSFNRAFKKVTGQTPSEYLSTINKDKS